MLRLTILTLFVFLAGSATAQESPSGDSLQGAGRCPRVYVCLSTGINNATGPLGVQAEMPVGGRYSACLGAGISTWGPKTALEGRYYFSSYRSGFALGLGATYNLGGYELAIAGTTSIGGRYDATFRQRPAFNAMVSAYYFKALGRRSNRFHVQAGYSQPLNSERLEQLSGDPLDPDASRPLQIISPGGLILAAGFSIGFGR